MAERLRRRLGSRLLWMVLLGVTAYLTNLAPLPLSFGLHFLFGGLFAMLAAILYGPWAGAAIAALGAIPTLKLWGHPFALLSMTLEAWVVGYEARRGKLHHTETDLAYWLLVGGPLVLVTYSVGAHIPMMATGVAALKQAVNGLVNTSVASVLVLVIVWWQRDRRQLPLEVFLSNLITFLVLAPLAFSLNWMARESGQQLRSQLSGEAIRAGDVVRAGLERELGDQRRALLSLALQAGAAPLPGELPIGMKAVWLLDATGRVAAYLPTDAPPAPPDLREVQPGTIRDLPGLAGKTVILDEPLGALSSRPYARAVAVLDLDRVGGRILAEIAPLGMEVVVADAANQVVLASWEGVGQGGTFVSDLGQVAFFHRAERAEGSALGPILGGREADATSLEQAERLVFVHRAQERQFGWQIYVRKPLDVVEYLLYRSYLRSYLIALGLITLLLVTIRLVAYTVTRPLVQLAAITVTPEGELTNLPPEQPIWVTEVRAVTAHLEEVGGRIRSLVASLQESQRELEQHNVELAVANIQLASEATRDAETGLYNQRAFQHQVGLWVEENHPFTLVLADLQGFHARVESLGHRRAEEWLRALATDLQQSAALHGGEAYRQGSERFALLFPESNPWLVERMTRVLASAEGRLGEFRSGAARYPEDGQTLPAVLEIANERLHQARRPAP